MELPSWLPPLFDVTQWDHVTYDLLYEIFRKDFILNKTVYCKRHVGFPSVKEDGKEKVFWHITTRQEKNSIERLPDLRRSERLPWLKPMLENSVAPEILAWENTEGDGTIKIYVWLPDLDYLAIIKKTKNGGLILITAHWVQYKNYKEKLKKKYEGRNRKANA